MCTLTDADGSASRPAVILLADSHRHPDETESRVALIDDAASVVVILPDDLAVDDGLRGAAVAGCEREGREVTLPLPLRSSDAGMTLRRTSEGPTETLDQRSAPEPVGQTLAHPGAHQRVSRVAGEDGGRSVHSQRADLVAVRRSSQVAAGND